MALKRARGIGRASGGRGPLLLATLTGVALLSGGCSTPAGRSTDRLGTTALVNSERVTPEAIPMGDPTVQRRIVREGQGDNRVMSHLTHLSQEIGPRLTGSSRCEQANYWASDRFREWGLSNVEVRQWGTVPVRFDRGESHGRVLAPERRRRGRDNEASTANELKVVREMQLSTLAWTSGTDGPKRGHVVRMPESVEAYEQIKDRLDGAWVLVPPPSPTGRTGIRGVGHLAGERYRQRNDARKIISSGKPTAADAPVEEFVLRHAVHGFITSSRDERVWTTSCPGWRELDPLNIPTDCEVIIRLSDYDYINSRLTDGEEIQVEFDIDNQLKPGPWPVYNTIAEIPGTTRPDEVVIVSGHLDSWDGPGSQGTTDNGTGSAVTLETARLLMAAGAKPDRTIRFILWTGEEQGLLGSREYVKSLSAAELAKISAVFVDDGGTNTQGGLRCVEAMIPMLAAATAPVNDLFVDDVTGEPLNVDVKVEEKFEQIGGSDHASFVQVGVPGFFWNEVGRAEYGYGWHTQNDRLDLAIERYLQQSSVCSAITAYNLACAPGLLPRFGDSGGDAFSPPERVTASDGAYNDYVLIEWRRVRAADRYDLLRATSEDPAAAELLKSDLTETQFEDRTAEPGTRYWYWVEGRRGDAERTGRSSEPEGGFHGAPPALVGITATQEECGGVRLTWSGMDGLSKVQVFAGTGAGSPDTREGPLVVVESEAEEYRDVRDPANTQTRAYWLRGVGARGPGAWVRVEGRTRPCE